MSSKVPTIIEIFFSLLLKHPFDTAEEGIYLHTRTDEKLFDPFRLKPKTKVKKKHCDKRHAVCRRCRSSKIQPITTSILMDRLANICTDFGLTISLKKTKVLAQATLVNKTVNKYQLKVVDKLFL